MVATAAATAAFWRSSWAGAASSTAPTQSRPGTTAAARTPSPTLPPRPVHSISFVGEPEVAGPGTRNAVAWSGVQATASAIGATASAAWPASVVDLAAAIEQAATSGSEVVVTVGQAAATLTDRAAAAHPSVHFIALEEAVPERSNVQSIVFDEVEVGYLAGVVAASLSKTGNVGLMLGVPGEAVADNYASGFGQGIQMAAGTAVASVEYAGAHDAPARGRAAAARLVTAGADIVVAPDSLSGVGALREACSRHLRVVGLADDVYLEFPDLRSCVATSVEKRYDAAVRAAIVTYATGLPLTARVVADVASEGITVGAFYGQVPSDVVARIARVVDAMRKGPPRPTPAPSLPTPAPTPESTPVPSASAPLTPSLPAGPLPTGSR